MRKLLSEPTKESLAGSIRVAAVFPGRRPGRRLRTVKDKLASLLQDYPQAEAQLLATVSQAGRVVLDPGRPTRA